MKAFSATISISARPETVWAILTDVRGYPGWNSTVESLDGEIVPGGRLNLRVKAAPGRPFRLVVSRFEPPLRMVWEGGMPLGLFVGARRFEVAPVGAGSRFTMAETYRGALAPLVTRALPDLQPSFDAFAADLKRKAETAA